MPRHGYTSSRDFETLEDYMDYLEAVARFNTPKPGEKWCEADFVYDPIKDREPRE